MIGWEGQWVSSLQRARNLKESQTRYLTWNVGLSSGRILRRAYSRVVETLAWPSHSWTLAISASCESALVWPPRRASSTHTTRFLQPLKSISSGRPVNSCTRSTSAPRASRMPPARSQDRSQSIRTTRTFRHRTHRIWQWIRAELPEWRVADSTIGLTK
jgi:hypothetical protein